MTIRMKNMTVLDAVFYSVVVGLAPVFAEAIILTKSCARDRFARAFISENATEALLLALGLFSIGFCVTLVWNLVRVFRAR